MLVGYKYARDEQGRVIHKNGIPQATDELQNLGNGVYKYTGGWSNTLRFRDFSLSFLIDYKAGASLFSGTNYSLYSEVCTRVRCLAVQLITREAVALSVPVS